VQIYSTNTFKCKACTDLGKNQNNRLSNATPTFSGNKNNFNSIVNVLIDTLQMSIKMNSVMLDLFQDSILSQQNIMRDSLAKLKELEFEARPENIEFIEAETLEEATDFAKNTLGVKNYNISNLASANIVNEALVDVSNLANGKCPLPEKITYENLYGPAAQMQNRHLILDKYSFEDCYNFNRLQYIYHEMGHLLHTNNIVSKESHGIVSECQRHIKESESQLAVLSSKIEEDKKKLKQLQELLTPSPKTLSEKLASFFNTKHNKKPEDILNGIRESMLAGSIDEKEAEEDIEEKEDILILLSKWGDKEKAIAEKVSEYAATSSKEFVAETFSQLCIKGIKRMPREVMDLYKKYNGPILNDF